MTPYPVASVLPREPPPPTGLPVMTPGVYAPRIREYSSIIQPIICGLVPTSGAGTSWSGPISDHSWRIYPRHSFSCSFRLNVAGLMGIPPLPPPNGIFATAHFQVIHIANARTVSTVSEGWNRSPPFVGPRASLCCTRKP